MDQETNSIPTKTSQKNPARSYPRPGFGTLLHSRRYTRMNYFLAAAFMLVPLPVLALYAIITGPTQSVGYEVGVVAFSVGMGAAGSAPFLFKGLRKRGLIIEAYEYGMRFVWPSGRELAFLFADVKEMKKKTFRGALAKLTFVPADGQSHTVDVNGSKDVLMVQDVLARFGPMRWEADRGFRIS